MPFCYVREGEKSTMESDGGVKIFYQRYGRGKIKVLLIIGLAGTHDGWGPQVKGLTGTEVPNKDEERILMEGGVVNFDGLDEMGKEDGGVEVCCFDNRGMGKSSIPTKKSEYTTTKMAKDALALLDHLGWKKAHVFGHSMGAMIACKLAAVAPDRLCSLALLNVTGGGFQCFPKLDIQMISLAYRFLRAKTPEQRALVDLETHYTKEYLKEHLGASTRGEMLYHEYAKAISSAGMQSHYGLEGQLNACWTHKMSSKDLDIIRSAGFLVLILHGRYDIIAQVCHARKFAHKLQPAARMVELHGAHLVSHERPEEVNGFLLELIRSSELNIGVQEWSSLRQNEADGLSTSVSILLDKKDYRQTNCFVSVYEILAKIWLCVMYFFSLFLVAFEQTRNAYKLLKPARVATSV